MKAGVQNSLWDAQRQFFMQVYDANGKLTSVVCTTCGSDDPSEFMTEAELEEQSG